jgi:F0F1-type ATP synthase membrane subunit c/vacuolar-type H+-ATPase subunit K
VSGALSAPDLDEKLAASARTLTVIARGMGAGLLLFAAADVVVYLRAVDRSPTPESLRTINLLTTIAMGYALAGIFVSEMLWRSKLRAAREEDVAATVRTAFIVRTAVREGAALLGVVVALLAAQGGILRVYPAYWADFAPAALFGSYLWAHWPSAANLKAELAEVLGGRG